MIIVVLALLIILHSLLYIVNYSVSISVVPFLFISYSEHIEAYVVATRTSQWPPNRGAFEKAFRAPKGGATVSEDGLGRLHWSNTEGFSEFESTASRQGSVGAAAASKDGPSSYVHRATEALIRDMDMNPYAPMSIYEPTLDRLRNVARPC